MSEATSAATPPAVTAAQFRSRSPRGVRFKNSTTHPTQMSCSIRCTAADFHTRPLAVKYPLNTDESAMHGRLSAVIFRERTVRASPTHKKPTGSAR